MAKTKNKSFMTPAGTAVYPYLVKADFQFDTDGKFHTKLRISEADAKPFIEDLKATAKEEFGDKASKAVLPFKKTDTGDYEFTVKTRFKPKFVDSTGKVIPEGNVPHIFGGSTLKTAGTQYCYNAGGSIGVSLQLSHVQIVELANNGLTEVDFGSVEGGFIAEAANDNNDTEEGASYNF